MSCLISQKVALEKWLQTSEMKIVNQKRSSQNIPLKSIDSFVIIAKTSSSITLSPTGIVLKVTLISRDKACGLTNSKKGNIWDTFTKV